MRSRLCLVAALVVLALATTAMAKKSPTPPPTGAEALAKAQEDMDFSEGFTGALLDQLRKDSEKKTPKVLAVAKDRTCGAFGKEAKRRVGKPCKLAESPPSVDPKLPGVPAGVMDQFNRAMCGCGIGFLRELEKQDLAATKKGEPGLAGLCGLEPSRVTEVRENLRGNAPCKQFPGESLWLPEWRYHETLGNLDDKETGGGGADL